jgi:hypothetical protein
VPKPSSSVRPVHFEDFSGAEFERLVFAYHCRVEQWKSIEWYGQAGSDLGRDIWGGRPNGDTLCIQCVNRENLTLSKVLSDLSKVLSGPNGIPIEFRFVARAKISSKRRDKIKEYVQSRGVENCVPWSGPEFEEFLRRDCEALLKRFCEGEPFPDSPSELNSLAESMGPLEDGAILALYARAFDRAAFYTPIYRESDMSEFKQAITDTIQVLGTGILKDREGRVFGKIPSRHELRSDGLRKKMQSVEMALSRLRAKYDEMTKSGVLHRCCDDPHCKIYYFDTPDATRELEAIRKDALDKFKDTYPAFEMGDWNS